MLELADIEKQNKELQEENERLKKDSEENQDLATIAYIQGAGKNKAKLDEAKEIIRELIDNLGRFYDDYPDFVLKAEAFLKECVK